MNALSAPLTGAEAAIRSAHIKAEAQAAAEAEARATAEAEARAAAEERAEHNEWLADQYAEAYHERIEAQERLEEAEKDLRDWNYDHPGPPKSRLHRLERSSRQHEVEKRRRQYEEALENQNHWKERLDAGLGPEPTLMSLESPDDQPEPTLMSFASADDHTSSSTLKRFIRALSTATAVIAVLVSISMLVGRLTAPEKPATGPTPAVMQPGAKASQSQSTAPTEHGQPAPRQEQKPQPEPVSGQAPQGPAEKMPVPEDESRTANEPQPSPEPGPAPDPAPGPAPPPPASASDGQGPKNTAPDFGPDPWTSTPWDSGFELPGLPDFGGGFFDEAPTAEVPEDDTTTGTESNGTEETVGTDTQTGGDDAQTGRMLQNEDNTQTDTDGARTDSGGGTDNEDATVY